MSVAWECAEPEAAPPSLPEAHVLKTTDEVALTQTSPFGNRVRGARARYFPCRSTIESE